jgi:hypothetical protein
LAPPTQEASLKSHLSVLDRTSSTPGYIPEDVVCSAAPKGSCDQGSHLNRASPGRAHPKAAGPVWVTDSRSPGTVVALRDGACLPSARFPVPPPPDVHGFRSPECELSPPYKEDCTRGPRSFVDVLDCLL